MRGLVFLLIAAVLPGSGLRPSIPEQRHSVDHHHPIRQQHTSRIEDQSRTGHAATASIGFFAMKTTWPSSPTN